MNQRLFCIGIASLLGSASLAACSGDDPPAPPPAPTRGYVAAPAHVPPAPRSLPPVEAMPFDPAEVTPDQPENVQVRP